MFKSLFNRKPKTWVPEDLLYDFRITEVIPEGYHLQIRLVGTEEWTDVPDRYKNGAGDTITKPYFTSIGTARHVVVQWNNAEHQRRNLEVYKAKLPRVIEEKVS